MATARLIAKSLSTSERRARLHQEAGPLAEFCQALYPLIVAHSDDHGRLDGSVFHVKHAIEPTSPRTVTEFESALFALVTVGLVDWYFDSNGKAVLQVVDFKKHQPGLKQRDNSKFEPLNMARRVMPGNAVDTTATPPDLNLLDSKRTETIKSSGASAPRLPDDNVSVITVIVHEALNSLGDDCEPEDLFETVKQLCAKRKIAYDGNSVGKAIDSARVNRRPRKSA